MEQHSEKTDCPDSFPEIFCSGKNLVNSNNYSKKKIGIDTLSELVSQNYPPAKEWFDEHSEKKSADGYYLKYRYLLQTQQPYCKDYNSVFPLDEARQLLYKSAKKGYQLAVCDMDTRASSGDLNISKILSELRLPIKCYESVYKYILSARNNLSEYENKLKPKVEECYSYLQKRRVKYLVHFTPMVNLKSILENGIYPRNSIPLTAVCTDPERRDKLLDHGCYSISYPNYPMLYTKQKKLKIPCVVLYIDIKVLQLFHFNNLLYVNKNASSPEFKYNLDSHRGIGYLKNIFQTEPRSKKCPRNGASDIQSEILIKGVIPPEFIRWIYVENENDRGQVISIGFDPMKVSISKDYYGRENQKNWEIPPYDDKNC